MKSSYCQSKAIVLKKIPYAESDLIVTFLTEEGRKQTLFAPQARKSQKRFGGALDLFNLLKIYFQAKNSSLCRLESVDLIDSLSAIRTDLSKFATACYFAEMILEFLKEDESSPAIFDGFLDLLNRFHQTENLPSALIPLMEHYLLDHFGFRPTLSHCLVCRTAIQSQERYYFNGLKGGIVCASCKQGEKPKRIHSNGDHHELSYSAIQRLLEGPPSGFASSKNLDWETHEVSQTRRALEYFIQYTAGKPFKSLQFLSKILP